MAHTATPTTGWLKFPFAVCHPWAAAGSGAESDRENAATCHAGGGRDGGARGGGRTSQPEPPLNLAGLGFGTFHSSPRRLTGQTLALAAAAADGVTRGGDPPPLPALLVRAALVCKRWCRLVSSPRFRRRYRELHRTPPMLGFFCNILDEGTRSCFVPAAADAAFCAPDASLRRCACSTPATAASCSSAVGLQGTPSWSGTPSSTRRWCCSLSICRGTPTDGRRRSSAPRPAHATILIATADPSSSFVRALVVLGRCSSAPTHLMLVAGASTSPQSCPWTVFWTPSVLVGKALYFGFLVIKTLLKYDPESHEMSVIGVPHAVYHWRHFLLDGGLALATVQESKLCTWRKADPEVDAGWTQDRVIDLETLLPADGIDVIGFADGIDVIFLTAHFTLFTIDLKTNEVKVVCKGKSIGSTIPYMTFYTPGANAMDGDLKDVQWPC